MLKFIKKFINSIKSSILGGTTSCEEFILIISVDFLPNIGGISLMTHELANSFQENGENVLVLAPKGSYIPKEYDNKYHFIIDSEYNKSKRAGSGAYEEDHRIFKLLKDINSEYSVKKLLLLHPFHYGVASIKFSKIFNIPVSVYFHGMEIRSQLLKGYPRNLKKLIEDNMPLTLRERCFYTVGACDQICVNSNYTKSIFDGFNIKPAIHVSGCGVNSKYFNYYRSISSEKLALLKASRKSSFCNSNEILIGFVGRIVINKNIKSILKIICLNKAYRAIIVGDGPDLENLRNYCISKGIIERVKFVGKVSEQEKWNILEALDFIALLSKEIKETGNIEGFGIALIEGSLVGAIPVTSGTGGMLDIVSNYHLGIVSPIGDESRGAYLISKVFSDTELFERIQNNARSQVLNKFNWNFISKNLLKSWQL